MSIAITQSASQHRSRHTATASNALRPGRYPYESGWNTGSTSGSKTIAATVCAILSATVGTPSTLTPRPPGLSISTIRTGDGK